MEEKLPCPKHEEQIKTLFEKDKATNRRIDDMGDLREVIHNLDKNMALQTQMMQHMAERNDRQDRRMDDQDNRMEEMIKVNTHLAELSESQRISDLRNAQMDTDLKDLKLEVIDNRAKYLIDTRDIAKEKEVNKLKKWGEPVVIISAIGVILLKIIEFFKG